MELRVARPVEIQTERNGGIDPVTDPEAGKCRFLAKLRKIQSWPNFRNPPFIILVLILNTILKLSGQLDYGKSGFVVSKLEKIRSYLLRNLVWI